MLISDDFGYLRDALSRCEAYLATPGAPTIRM